jgi:hypothetical protein
VVAVVGGGGARKERCARASSGTKTTAAPRATRTKPLGSPLKRGNDGIRLGGKSERADHNTYPTRANGCIFPFKQPTPASEVTRGRLTVTVILCDV